MPLIPAEAEDWYALCWDETDLWKALCDAVCMQVGCPMRCTFCATGKGGFARNLQAHEIIDQVMTVQERFGTRVSNVGVIRRLSTAYRVNLCCMTCS